MTSDVRTKTGWTGLAYNIGYTLDKDGNRTTVTRNGVPSTCTYDANDKFGGGDGLIVRLFPPGFELLTVRGLPLPP